MATNKPANLNDLQKAINDISKDALKYLTDNKASVTTFHDQIGYAGYDAATLIGILKDKGGATLAQDVVKMIVMRYVRGTGFVKDVTKKTKATAGSEEAAALVARYGLVSSVGSNANAITLGRVAQLFPNVSFEVTKQFTGLKMAIDSSDLSMSGTDSLLWDFVPQYITLDSSSAPYCTTKSVAHILFSIHVIHAFLVTKKTMPEAKKKERGLLKDIDIIKYTTGLLVITCQSKNLNEAKKKSGRTKVCEPYCVNEKFKESFLALLASFGKNVVCSYGTQVKQFLAEQCSLMKTIVDNSSKTQDEMKALIIEFFEEE
ncbi:nucleocapsid protein [Tenuivirus zeae]|uniref:Nucleoprotein n=1 Tax=Maize stripe virus TaxID=3052767 RepID=NCAP_MSTV|nr:nucleocapsid protein [Tenuivirus zeae]P27207.2 RecName: Full=Nucleoprotein; AltName: Full=Coat protein; Short=CP; AltName: Full=Nucleocapsid protein; Short=Protein N; AltName: Full=Protein pc3 [Tenuivirus zeae]AAA46637.1 nucleocapsid protein [Tenuivirus zeae]